MVEYIRDMWDLAAAGDRQGVFFFIVVYVLVILTYSLFYQRYVASWSGTRGKLVQLGLRIFGATGWVISEQEYVTTSLYEYSVGGEKFQGKRVSPWAIVASYNVRFVLNKQMKHIKRYGDDGVEVYFNPKNPEKSFLIKPGKMGMAVTAMLAVAPMLFYVFEYHA